MSRSDSSEGLGSLVWLIIIALVALVATFTGNDDVAVEVAKKNGYTQIDVKSTHRWIMAEWKGCGDDWKATVIEAKSPEGRWVTFKVCEGFFLKGATIRF